MHTPPRGGRVKYPQVFETGPVPLLTYHKREIRRGVSPDMARQKTAELRDFDASAGPQTASKQSTNSGVKTASRMTGEHLAVEHRPVADLIPYARNARTHSDAQVAEIAASIRAFGWTNPILVDGENGIIAGHGRLLAARKLKLASVPVIELAGLSEAEKRAYILADNKLAR